MKNKVKLKKLLIKLSILSIVILFISLIVSIKEYNIYTYNFNKKIENIVSIIVEKYPDVKETELMEILNNSFSQKQILKKYNIDINKDSIVLENQNSLHKNMIINSILILISIVIFIIMFLKFNNCKDKEINEITKYIEEINKKNYKLNIDENSEDELSILKNEIYKTTIMLKEQAENLNKDKKDLKISLSDISHQLKTPLTSILIILDNLLENDDMDKDIRQDFIFDIKREINNINFLVQNLLKLSKLDTNTVKFNNEEICLNNVVNESVKKLSMLCDLKDIKIIINCTEKIWINSDFIWQIEAISNILKNCIEYSNEHEQVEIGIEKNKMYSEITIKDYGKGIDKKDLPHIFERFYKSKNSSKDSIGIGLALAKKIIEQSNGKIIVESKVNEGTKFIIRYYNDLKCR